MSNDRVTAKGDRSRPTAGKKSSATPAQAAPALSRMADARLQRALSNPASASAADLKALQRAVGNRAVQRLAGDTAQRSSDPGLRQGGPIDSQTETGIQQARGGGAPLPGEVRAPMEQAFGADFSPVRVHTGPNAAQLNRSVSATAFTVGSDIFFNNGAYNPGSSTGKHLLAHELTHVVQQGGSGATAQRKLTVGPAGDSYEQEADRVAGQVMQRAAAPGISRLGAKVQRQEQEIGEGGPRIKNEDFEYEIIGHRLAYRKDTTGAEDWLDRIGYQRQFAGEASGFGFRVVLLMPKEGSGRTPILAFKGSNKAPDFIVDMDPIAVGFLAFKHNQDKVKALIEQAGGRVDVTGHSLGGALAQHCASAFPGSIRRVVTFQSPGISMIQAGMFDSREDKPEVTHHVAMGDVVDLAGGKHLGGQTFTHGTRGKGVGGIGKGHTSYLLNSEALSEQREGAGITPELLEGLGLTGSKMENATGDVQEHANYPFWARGFGAERGREILGGIAGIPYGLIAGLGLAGKYAMKGAKAAGKGIWSGMKAMGRGAAALGKGLWGGMKAMGRGIGKGATALGKGLWGGLKAMGKGLGAMGGGIAQFMTASYAAFFRRPQD